MNTHSTTSNEGWIEWNGGKCPVAEITLVDVRWNNDAISKCAPASTWSAQGMQSPTDFWQRRLPANGTGSYIIAYRIVEQGK